MNEYEARVRAKDALSDAPRDGKPVFNITPEGDDERILASCADFKTGNAVSLSGVLHRVATVEMVVALCHCAGLPEPWAG